MLSITHILALNDNYIWIAKNRAKQCVIVDPSEADPVLDYLEHEQLTPVGIFVTHHHHDHIDGIKKLVTQFPDLPVYGPSTDRFPMVTVPLDHHDRIHILETEFRIIQTAGHTQDHIVYYAEGILFCGDTLFSGGCGRLFEGTAAQMLHSLDLLAALPADTHVYCAHEYTQANLKFAAEIDPSNIKLHEYVNKVANLRANKQTTLPSTIGLEREINPFLRVRNINIISATKHRAQGNKDTDIFAALRRWKDEF